MGSLQIARETLFLKPFFEAAQRLESVDWSTSATFSVKQLETLRIHAFRLQSLGRILQRSTKKKEQIITAGTELREHAKFIEDAIGKHLAVDEMSSFFVNESEDLRQAANEERAKSLESLVERGSELHRRSKTLAETSFWSQHQDFYKLYRKGLRRSLKKIGKDISKIDPDLLEDGTHELRRKIRWILMGISYPTGLFIYEKTESAIVFDKYTDLGPSEERNPICIPPEPVVRLSGFVKELGEQKDLGLVRYHRQRLLNSDGVVDMNLSSPEAIQKTREIQLSIVEKCDVENLRKALSR